MERKKSKDVLEKILLEEKIVILDGATGTYLSQLGFTGITPELACLSHPELVLKLHQDYVDSGARIILTNTFGANCFRLEKKGLLDKLGKLNSKAAQLAGQVKKQNSRILIAGDMGPTGELMEPWGKLSSQKACACFQQQAEILVENGVDFLLLETFSDLTEAALAYETVKKICSLPVVLSFSLTPGKQYRTMMGQSLTELTAWAEKEKLSVLGFNCGLGSAEMVEVASQVKKLTSLALWFKPNAGLPLLQEGKVIYPEKPEEFASHCLQIVAGGDCFIGGCCGTNPNYLSVLSRQVKSFRTMPVL